MKHYYYHCLLILSFLIFSCSDKQHGDLPVIPVDVVNNIVSQLPLTEIAETIKAIELELTDESVIDLRRIHRIILCDNLVFIAQEANILVFEEDGSFVRSIGSKGQGPGEYIRCHNIAVDETNKRLFVNAFSKIICYDFLGNVLMESSFSQLNGWKTIKDINYFNNELLLILRSMDQEDEKGVFSQVELFRLNDNFIIVDSCTILKHYEERSGFSEDLLQDYILISDSTVYLYYPFSTALPPILISSGRVKQQKSFLRDTLYRFENNKLIPELKIKFKNDGIDAEGYMFINISHVYRSSRYIFAKYYNYRQGLYDNEHYYSYVFCYDTKTKKGYRVLMDRYTDDFNQIEHILFHPFHTNPEMFYYWYTHLKPDDREEPNPTIYIGRLKK